MATKVQLIEMLKKAKRDTAAINEAIQDALSSDLTQNNLETVIRKLDEHVVIMLIDDFRGIE